MGWLARRGARHAGVAGSVEPIPGLGASQSARLRRLVVSELESAGHLVDAGADAHTITASGHPVDLVDLAQLLVQLHGVMEPLDVVEDYLWSRGLLEPAELEHEVAPRRLRPQRPQPANPHHVDPEMWQLLQESLEVLPGESEEPHPARAQSTPIRSLWGSVPGEDPVVAPSGVVLRRAMPELATAGASPSRRVWPRKAARV